MKNILKTYFIGAVIIYPIMLFWAFNDMWSNNTNAYTVIMKLYGILILPTLGLYFHSKNQKLLSYLFFIFFAFVILYIILFPALII